MVAPKKMKKRKKKPRSCWLIIHQLIPLFRLNVSQFWGSVCEQIKLSSLAKARNKRLPLPESHNACGASSDLIKAKWNLFSPPKTIRSFCPEPSAEPAELQCLMKQNFRRNHFFSFFFDSQLSVKLCASDSDFHSMRSFLFNDQSAHLLFSCCFA